MAISRPRYNSKKKRRSPSKFKRGYYKPINENKYIQPADKTMNSCPLPEYRSSWELAMFKWADQNPDIIAWSTESVAIPYVSPKDNQIHRYFPDMFIVIKGKKIIIEIKPAKQMEMPINKAKWEAAERYAKKIGAAFVVVTEKELKAWGLIKK